MQSSIALLLLVAFVQRAAEGTTSVRVWRQTYDSLSDYEAVRSSSVQSEVECTAAASLDPATQLATFDSSSRLCTQFRCRLGLTHFRKCRNVNAGTQRVWTLQPAGNDCWTTVQHRVSDSVDFYRNWTQYQSGFGDGPDGNFWIGLNALHAMTSSGSRKVRFLMKAWNESESWVEYSSFSVGPEAGNYILSVSGFSSSPGIGDSLGWSNGCQFSTYDADHDKSLDKCAVDYHGAWWFNSCFSTHPNGKYLNFSKAIGGAYA